MDVAVIPPFTALRSVQTLIDGDKLRISYGAQDLSPHDEGAYTGDISAAMLAKLGCDYVLAGHSERRQYHAETDDLVGAKVQAALRWELTPILCVGEPLEIRQAGQHIEHILRQLDAALKGIPAAGVAGMVVAYEPVWPSGPVRWPPRRMLRRRPRRSGREFRTSMTPRRRAVSVSCMAGPLSPAASRRLWRSPTWTAPLWAGPALMPDSSLRSAGMVNSQRKLVSVAPAEDG